MQVNDPESIGIIKKKLMQISSKNQVAEEIDDDEDKENISLNELVERRLEQAA